MQQALFMQKKKKDFTQQDLETEEWIVVMTNV